MGVQGLLQRTENLKDHLAGVITQLDAGVTLELRRREVLREMRIGRSRLEFFAAKARALRLKKKFYRMKALEGTEEPPDSWMEALSRLEESLEEDFSPFYRKLSRMETVHQAALDEAERIQGEADPQALRRAYRRLVRVFHPQVEPVRGRDCRELWNRADKALLEGDAAGLEALREGPETCRAVQGFSLGDQELRRESLRLEGVIREKEGLLEQRRLRLERLEGGGGGAGEAEWISRMSRRLQEGRVEWEQAERFYRERIADLLYRIDPSLGWHPFLGQEGETRDGAAVP